ncbi:chemotaxis protein CheA [Pseudobowmanella zhangzhouensis]|uniref:Chemotaxis protein CheA n=1 Tax=Pseudobowmanella zhangzhouensis TaxID=1537679 RepID=A0ABW1XNU1_9ALTE
MSIDMEQFHAVFFDESQEHLDDMEQLLMELDLGDPDPEQLNSIFRAAHSIKGGSGIFGFDALTGLTHVMENLLDRARKGSMQLTVPVVDLFLQTVDLLKGILQAYRSDSALPEEAIAEGIQALEAVLNNENPPVANDEAEEDAGFGFFTDITPAESDNGDGSQPSEQQDEWEGFGFFEPVAEVQQKASEEQGYGFFEEPDPAKFNNEPQYGFHKPLDEIRQEAKYAAVQSEGPSTTGEAIPRREGQDNARVARQSTATKENTSIRVDTLKIDSMVNLVGELVITQSMLSMISEEVVGHCREKLQSAIAELQRNTREIQESVMSMRMLPINMTFNRFPRVVRDLSSKLGKKVELIIEGGATEIDKSMIEKLVDPLTHLVRNSIDHGIEKTDVRVEQGKSETGTVILRAEQKGSSIVISIIDDGAGLNRQRILSKASENGLPSDPGMLDKEVWQLIFQPGFSTAAEVTDVSGRGVGMDVVKRNIEEIGGRIEIESSVGKGSAFYIHLPLTLAIVDGMCVSIGEQIYVIPLVNILESLQPLAKQLKQIGNDSLLWIREQYWPLVKLYELMGVEGAIEQPTGAIVVLLESSKKRFGVQVDALLGQQQVVIKSLERHYRPVPGISGATIMGDGRVAMILDAESIADFANDRLIQE